MINRVCFFECILYVYMHVRVYVCLVWYDEYARARALECALSILLYQGRKSSKA